MCIRKNWAKFSASRLGKMKTALLRAATKGATMHIDIRKTGTTLTLQPQFVRQVIGQWRSAEISQAQPTELSVRGVNRRLSTFGLRCALRESSYLGVAAELSLKARRFSPSRELC